jgi:hypothetical protein
MFGKVKHWLGIEGVKLELLIPEEIDRNTSILNGKIRLASQNQQEVTQIKVVMIEKYTRGRGSEKRIDEYELGSITLRRNIEVPAEGAVEIDFSLPFELMDSEMDQIQRSNFLIGGVVKGLKLLEKVKSIYRIDAEAKVKGVALNPFDKKEIIIK